MTTNKPEALGFATHHDEPMLFPRKVEAAAYCEPGEEPIALMRLSDHEALQSECEKLRKDAERYRWLRESAVLDGGSDYLLPEIHAWHYPFGPLPNKKYEDLDAAIDAAMREK